MTNATHVARDSAPVSNVSDIIAKVTAFGASERDASVKAERLDGFKAIRVEAFVYVAQNNPHGNTPDLAGYVDQCTNAFVAGMGGGVKASTVTSYRSTMSTLCLCEHAGNLQPLLDTVEAIHGGENDASVKARMPKKFFGKLAKLASMARKNGAVPNRSDIRDVLTGAKESNILDDAAKHAKSAARSIAAMIEAAGSAGEVFRSHTNGYMPTADQLAILGDWLQAKADEHKANNAMQAVPEPAPTNNIPSTVQPDDGTDDGTDDGNNEIDATDDMASMLGVAA